MSYIPGVISCCRLFKDMQLEDWTRLGGLTGLTLRGVKESHHGTLAAVLPQMTALRSLVLADVSHPGLPAAGRWCDCLARPATRTEVQFHKRGFRQRATLPVHTIPLEDSPVSVCHASTTAELDRADGATAGCLAVS